VDIASASGTEDPVRILPGYKVLGKNMAIPLCIIDLMSIVDKVKYTCKGIGPKYKKRIVLF
jgi:hypothetical protein